MRDVSQMLALLGLTLAVGSAAACDRSTNRARCVGEADAATCQRGETCSWLHDGADYFCATLCSQGRLCPSGLTCKTGAASSCQTCQDLLDICE